MGDKRTAELVRSIETDFSTTRWIVEPVGANYQVGSGLYVLVPVANEEHGEALKALFADVAYQHPEN